MVSFFCFTKGGTRPVGFALVFNAVSQSQGLVDYKIRMNNTNVDSETAIDKFTINGNEIRSNFFEVLFLFVIFIFNLIHAITREREREKKVFFKKKPKKQKIRKKKTEMF